MGYRKRSWSEKEDQLLLDKVMQYTRKGKAQWEAFKAVAEEIHRTPAACGYRWNAKLRSSFQEDLKQARQYKDSNASINQKENIDKDSTKTENPMQLALQYLKCLDDYHIDSLEGIRKLSKLRQENAQLKKQLAYFEQAYSCIPFSQRSLKNGIEPSSIYLMDDLTTLF